MPVAIEYQIIRDRCNDTKNISNELSSGRKMSYFVCFL
jgi:hypothetical protein